MSDVTEDELIRIFYDYANATDRGMAIMRQDLVGFVSALGVGVQVLPPKPEPGLVVATWQEVQRRMGNGMTREKAVSSIHNDIRDGKLRLTESFNLEYL